MTLKRRKVPSIYDETTFKKKIISGNIFFHTFFILLLLMSVRFLNLTLQWNMARLELEKNQVLDDGVSSFFGLSGYKSAMAQFKKDVYFKHKKIVILSYYDILHPGIFLVYNRGPSTFLDLGRLLIQVAPGQSVITLYPTDIYRIQSETGHTATYFGYSLLSPFFENVAKRSVTDPKQKKPSGTTASFILKDLAKSKYLKIPYLIYFFIPLFFIVVIAISYDFSFLVALYYYVGLFILFDFKQVFVKVPFFWLFNHLNIQVSEMMASVISVFLLVLFLVFGTMGFSLWRKKENFLWMKRYVFFFLFLPIFLRF